MLWNRKYFFRDPDLRIRNRELESGSRSQLVTDPPDLDPEPDPTTIFLWPCCPIDIKSINIIKYITFSEVFRIFEKNKGPDLDPSFRIADPDQ